MQTYNYFNQGNIMPLLMNYTTPSPIQEIGSDLPSMGYNENTQISYEMRLVCTRSAKYHYRSRKSGSNWLGDYKNENDDTKSVR